MIQFQKTGGIPISKLKERFLPAEIFDYDRFIKLAERKDLNPSEIIYKDDEKAYFYNSVTCHYYFFEGLG